MGFINDGVTTLAPFLGPFGPMARAANNFSQGKYLPPGVGGLFPALNTGERPPNAAYPQGEDPMTAGGPPSPAAAPPLPPPINVGSGGAVAPLPAPPVDAFLGPHSVGGAPINPVSDGSFNNLDAAAGQGAGGYDIGARMRKAGGMFADPTERSASEREGNPMNVGPSQANGPDLIQKFMTYLHSKPRG